MEPIKLGICCNFSFPSIGGSELVIKHISERLVKNYNYKITVYSFSVYFSFCENGVNYVPCQKGDEFISQIAQNDHIFVYSDSFWEFDTLLQYIDKIDCGLSLSFVGAYHTQSHPESFKLLKENIDKFDLITHSSITPDYKWCIDNDLPVKVLPNGVDLAEFRDNRIDFSEKYNIKEKYIILAVSNYFYGKGFELLPQISKKLSENLDDFVIISMSNTVKYPYDKIFLDRTKKQSKGMNIKFLRDLPREDVVAAFNSSDVFLFTSKKEVAPLVILESRAAILPFVAMRVGNIAEQAGGIPVMFEEVDKKGYAVVNSGIVSHFACAIVHIIKRERIRESVIKEGQKEIEKIDWDNIVPLYNKVFSG